jgi:hypothetical protein
VSILSWTRLDDLVRQLLVGDHPFCFLAGCFVGWLFIDAGDIESMLLWWLHSLSQQHPD